MNRRQKIIVSITGIFVILLALVGLTYGYFLTRITGNENDKSISVTTANLELVYGDGNGALEPYGVIIPGDQIKFLNIKGKETTSDDEVVDLKTFTVTNKGEDTDYVVVIEETETKYVSNGSYVDEDNQVVTYNKGDATEFLSNDFRYILSCVVKDNKGNVLNDEKCNRVDTKSVFPIEGGILVENSIKKTRVHEYTLKMWYIDTGKNQSNDMNKTFKARVNITNVNQREIGVQEIDYSLMTGYQLDYISGKSIEKENYMITNYIAAEPGYLYTVTSNQTFDGFVNGVVTRCWLYDSDKNPSSLAYSTERTSTGLSSDSFEVTGNDKYFRIQFRVTDTDIKITKTPLDRAMVYTNSSYIQGIAVSDKYLFVSYSASYGENKNDYKIKKINRMTGELIKTSNSSFNHANGLTYNENTNKLLVVAKPEDIVSDLDYSLYLIDADSLTLETTVDLKDIVISVDPDSSGLGQIAYDSETNKYYVGARYGSKDNSKYIIVLNDDFTFDSSIYIGTKSEFPGTLGDFCVDSGFIYIPLYRSDLGILNNEVRIYNTSGEFINTKTINGLSHIESIDIIDGIFYLSFIHNEIPNSKVFSMNKLSDIY